MLLKKMNRVLIVLISIAFFISCGKESNQDEKERNTETNSTEEPSTTKSPSQTENELLAYFKDFPNDTVKVKVEPYTQERSFDPSECLPLTFLPLLENMIPQTRSESTGAKPVGKIQITDNKYLLVVVQQDDYGPIYYGLAYNSHENKIQKSEKIAEVWGDAGDYQGTYSLISLKNEKIIIQKFIETCHDEFEDNEEEIIVTSSECSDSTSTVEIKVE